MSCYRAFAIFLIVLVSGLASAEELLLGVAEHSRFKRSHFIGALYAPASAKKNTVYSGESPARMRMLITAKRISQQGFTESWVQGIAVNNDRDVLAANQRDILRFSELFKGPLFVGDSIDIVTDAKQLTVSLNGVELAQFDSARLFPVLLSTWIGRVPHSTPFKEGILGKLANTLLVKQLAAAAVDVERVAEVATWVSGLPLSPVVPTSPVPTPAVANQPQLAKASTLTQEAAVIDQPVNKAVVEAAEVKAAVAEETVVKQTVVKQAPIVVKDEPVVMAVVKAMAEPVAEAPLSSGAVVSDVARVDTVEQASKPEPVKAAALTEDELTQRLLVRQSYYAQLLSAVNVFKHVPQEAIMRRVSGEVRVLVEIDRRGRLLNTELVGASKYNFFNQQALDSVRKAVPFDPVPSELPGEVFEFELLIFYPPYY